MAGPKIDTRHPDYDAFSARWAKCRTAFDGEDAVKAGGTSFLPKPSGQELSEYEAYKARALFVEATSRTALGMIGRVFRKPATIEPGKWPDTWIEDCDLSDNHLHLFAYHALMETLLMGRFGVLVDWSNEENRPFLAAYPAESVINWRHERIGGKTVPVMIALEEEMWTAGENEFEPVETRQVRILRLVDGYYAQEVWQLRQGESDWIQLDAIEPHSHGERFDYIPFICIGSVTQGLQIERPPLLPLVNVNLSLYRTSADLEHGRHFGGCPQHWVAGYQLNKGESLTIGSPSAWVFPDPNTKIGISEYSGQGLGPLENAWDQKIEMLAALGANMLRPQKRAAETAEAKRMDDAGQVSALTAVTNSVSEGMTAALDIANQWAGGAPGEASYTLNRDFYASEITPQQLDSVVRNWIEGAYPQEVMLYNLRKYEFIPDGMTDEEVVDRLAEEGPRIADDAIGSAG